MSLTEKTAYLKGLYDGMGLNEDKSKEARMLGAIVDVLQEMAEHVEENEDSIAVLDDEVFELSEAIDQDEDDDIDDDDLYDFEDEDDEGDEDEEEEEVLELPAEIPCPACGESVTIGAEDLEEGSLKCPHCGRELQVEVESDDEEVPF